MKARIPTKGDVLKDYTEGITDRLLKMTCMALMKNNAHNL